ncbi:MAG: Histone transcription regulator 3 [Phylliscum demangeonii]|nr:MAG: Histone transcription regulator 3 [Phylliscum demangeonii]
MSGAWTAMNVLPDDEDSDEVDDTPELRIEEALRLYQNAIKLHAQGPSAYGETAKAYDALFESEAFQYDEQEPGPVLSEQDDYTTDDEESDGRQLVGRGRLSDRSPSSLAQLLHLAYKNRGQFKMDRLRYRLETGAAENSGSEAPSQIIDTASNAALEDFAEALKRDEGDLELWRRAGKLAERTGRARVARLCLESALSRLNGATVRENNLHQLTLEEGLAREQLNNVRIPKREVPGGY